MANFKLQFSTDGAAFGDPEEVDSYPENRADEIARILTATAERVRDGEMTGSLRDINGNTVGTYQLSTAEPFHLSDLAEDVRITCHGGQLEGRHGQEMHHWTVTLAYYGRTMNLDYFTGTGIDGAPTAGMVLDSLLSDASFTETCDDEFDRAEELGEEVTRESRADWLAIVKQTRELRELLGDDFDRFNTAERD